MFPLCRQELWILPETGDEPVETVDNSGAVEISELLLASNVAAP